MSDRVWEEAGDDDRELADEPLFQPGLASQVPETTGETDVEDEDEDAD